MAMPRLLLKYGIVNSKRNAMGCVGALDPKHLRLYEFNLFNRRNRSPSYIVKKCQQNRPPKLLRFIRDKIIVREF